MQSVSRAAGERGAQGTGRAGRRRRGLRAGIAAAALLLLAAGPARAQETPRQRFDALVSGVRETVTKANERVKRTLVTRDWNAWNAAHDDYVLVLMRGVADIERSISDYMLGVLGTGGQLDETAMRVIHAAADDAAMYARQRVLAGAYAKLTRRGVRPDRRGDALDLLAREGVYDLVDVSTRKAAGAVPLRPSAPAGELGESPLTGRVPGTPEAAEALSKWQYAYMSAQSAERKIATYEAQLASMPSNSPTRPRVQQSLDQVRQQHTQLLQAVREWREKYFAAGGR